ncbi:acyltransferase family protein [Sphingomonas sp. RRHST34]|uniref:Acyltransferase family protein n=1 Tax=Sphingomonas citri TaxID=2862499 RepID=A0ABS7BPR9_9SPHN|nr:acyltransferase family protein [Sphingomonas citri]MBW6531610.1 acyltransferase family protein [Sphingomonas citri]
MRTADDHRAFAPLPPPAVDDADTRRDDGRAISATLSRPREHHLDAVRGLLMLLGIPFHAAHPFRADGGSWFVLAGERSSALTAAMEFLHLFRMQGFFLLAGYFTAMLLLRQEAGTYLRSRMTRLLPPLLVSLCVLVPIANLLGALQEPDRAAAIARWRWQLTHVGRHTTGHLWFVIVLLYLSVASAAICRALPAVRAGWIAAPAWLSHRTLPALLIALALVTAVVQSALLLAVKVLPEIVNVPGAVIFAAEYLPYFVIGAALHRCQGAYQQFIRTNALVAIIGVVAAIYSVGWSGDLPAFVRRVPAAVAALCLTQVIVAGAATVFTAGRAWIKELVDASFVIYLVHLPLLIGLFWIVDSLTTSIALRFIVPSLLTLLISLLIWREVKRVPLLLFLLSGVRGREPRPALPPPG